MKLKEKLEKLPFRRAVEKLGGEIYAVGGAVRDELLGIESKDLDILIRLVDYEQLQKILPEYGRVDNVGQSFGIIKFNAGEEIDIALPRTEKKTGDKHTDFEVDYDCALPLAVDLKRRDFTINAIAMDTTGKLHDPYGGVKDIKEKLIRLVNEEAFKDDPLRMLRAVQFVSRFDGFSIEDATSKSMRKNSRLIKTVSSERVLLEFEKIAKKGDAKKALANLKNSDLYKQIFPDHWSTHSSEAYTTSKNIKTLGELMYYFSGLYWDASRYFREDMHGDTKTAHEIEALDTLYRSYRYSKGPRRVRMFEAFYKCEGTVNTQIFETKITHVQADLELFRKNELPMSLKYVDCNGYDIMQCGFTGPLIGEVFKKVVRAILLEDIENEKEAIRAFVNKL